MPVAETLNIPEGSQSEKYQAFLLQLKALIGSERDLMANMANITAALKEAFGFFWVGFYRVVGDELVLGPFQGPIACTRIPRNKGVCGACWQQEKTIIVPDVNAFPGHIACSSLTQSEIVIPVFDKAGKVALILDIDSTELSDFSEVDKIYLEQVASLVQESLC